MLTHNQLLDLKLQYNTQGFVHLEGILPPQIVERARAGFAKTEHAHRKSALDARARGDRFYDLPAILDADPVFIDLVDLPSLFPLLRSVVGEDIALNHTNARLFFPGPTFTSPYHSDIAQVLGIDPACSPGFLTKLHLYFEDLAADQGCLSFIPGSQHLPPLHVNGHRPTLGQSGAVTRIVPRAGDAILFNTHVLHMAEANRTASVRRSVIYTYGHFWMKAYPSAIPSDPGQFTGNPQRSQLFHVDMPGIGHFNRRLDKLEETGVVERLHGVCQRIVHRVLPITSLPPRA